MLRIPNNSSLQGLADFHPGIVYSRAGGQEISLDLIRPQISAADKRRFPLILFVQGSAWHCPNTYYEIPQLAQFAAAGYAVASIRHRNTADGFAAPAFLQDAKTAIRFLRANADEHRIDKERVYAFGTSSGGNTVLLLGLTGDDPAYKTEEYPAESDAVCGVIDCFGPTDLPALIEESKANGNPDFDAQALMEQFCGGTLDRELLMRMSPIQYVKEGRQFVPFLIAHGDADKVVDFSQSRRMAEKLIVCGAEAELICVEGGTHEGIFWSQQLLDYMLDFLNAQKRS